jgi:hypothetical protein
VWSRYRVGATRREIKTPEALAACIGAFGEIPDETMRRLREDSRRSIKPVVVFP